jgi:hypothetical protein
MFSLVPKNLIAQQPTVGLLQYDQEQEQQSGYVFFAPVYSTISYLIDKCGQQVHSWKSKYTPGFTATLLNDGSLLRSGVVENPVFNAPGGGGIIEKIGWDGTIDWSYRISDSSIRQHHAITPMPNGNILALVWEKKTNQEAIAMGRNPAKVGEVLWSEKIVEIKPNGFNSGTIVWEWKLWDHLIQNFDNERINFSPISEHPELIDINYITNANQKDPDWIHSNAIDYNPELDQIILSAHSFNEIWIIDHSTTTEQAATHSGGKSNKGGDIIYRWGNPAAYDRGTPADKKLFGQHDPQWIRRGLPDEGKIIIFNNGMGRMGNYSSIDILAPIMDNYGNYKLETNNTYAPLLPEWTYTDPIRSNFFAFNQSGAQRLPNGNLLVCVSTTGTFFEVTPDKKIIWKYICPVTLTGITKQGDKPTGNSSFRVELFPKNFIGFEGRDLTPSNPIELQPLPSLCTTTSVKADNETNSLKIYPNPVEEILQIQFGTTIPTEVSLISSLGEVVLSQKINSGKESCSLDIRIIPAGMYILKLVSPISTSVEKVMIVR